MDGRFYARYVPTLDDVDREQLVQVLLHLIDNAHDRPDQVPASTQLMWAVISAIVPAS